MCHRTNTIRIKSLGDLKQGLLFFSRNKQILLRLIIRKEIKSIAKTWFEWDELYNKFESMYNPYPVQMSRSEAFGKARNDGLITDEEYREARKFYGNLWNYTGD